MLGEIMTFHCGIDGSTKRPTFQDSRTWRTDIGMSKTKKKLLVIQYFFHRRKMILFDIIFNIIMHISRSRKHIKVIREKIFEGEIRKFLFNHRKLFGFFFILRIYVIHIINLGKVTCVDERKIPLKRHHISDLTYI